MIDVNVSQTGLIEEADLSVEIIAIPTMPIASEKWNKISFVGLAGQTSLTIGEHGMQFCSDDLEQLALYFDEGESDAFCNFKGYVNFFNIANLSPIEDLQKIAKNASIYGDTLIVSSSLSQKMVANSLVLDVPVTILSTVNPISDSFLAYASKPYHAVMIDDLKEGHALLASTYMLYNANVPNYTNHISVPNLTAVVSKNEANLLEENNISYFFNFKADNKLDWFAMGGEQAFCVYLDLLVKFKVKQDLAKEIRQNASMGFNASRLSAIESRIYGSISSISNYLSNFQAFLPSFNIVSLEDKRQGRLTGVKVSYKINGELRRISLTIDGGLY